MKNGELMVAALDRLGDAAQLDHLSVDHRLHRRPEVIGNARGTGAVGMNAVRLIQSGNASDPLQQKRHELDFVFARQILKHLAKRARV